MFSLRSQSQKIFSAFESARVAISAIQFHVPKFPSPTVVEFQWDLENLKSLPKTHALTKLQWQMY